MSNKNILVAGPWVGEFGWELMSWQGYVRDKAKAYDETVVVGFRNREYLYEDFADAYIPHDLVGDRDCWRIKGAEQAVIKLEETVHRVASSLEADILKPAGLVLPEVQDFFKYGSDLELEYTEKFDVVLHFRRRGDRGLERNQEDEVANKCVELLKKKGLHVAAMGSREEAYCPEGCRDIRGLPLKKTCDILSGAGILAGVASGPTLLASLCGTPFVAFTTKRWYSAIRATNKERLEFMWNPFKTKCVVVEDYGFEPNAEQMVESIEQGLTKCLT